MVAIHGKSDVEKLVKITECFGKVSSSKVNWEKITALIVGKWQRNEPKLPARLKWLKSGIEYLGVHLGDQSEELKNCEN